ncbi:MAG: DUF3108 domain-containing protein [bacterium]
MADNRQRPARGIATTLLLVVLAAGCGTRDLTEKVSVSLPPVADGEVSTYRIVTPAGEAGTLVTAVHHDWHEKTPVYRLTVTARTLTGAVETTDSSLVVMRQVDLRPVVSYRFIRTGGALLTTAANYGEGSIAVSTWMHTGQEHQRLLPTDVRSFDTDQLTFLGRALRPRPGRPVKLTVIEPLGPPPGGNLRPGEFEALPDEEVTVPAGRFDCRKLALTVGDSRLELWYEKSGAGRLVRYSAVGTDIILELLDELRE